VKLGFLEIYITGKFWKYLADLKEKRVEVRPMTYSLDNIDSAATTKKATPVQNKSPVKK
jgi:hypothetical protein